MHSYAVRWIGAWMALLVLVAGPPAAAQGNSILPDQNVSAPRKPTPGQDAFVSELSRIEREIGRVNANLRSLSEVAGAGDLTESRSALDALIARSNEATFCASGRPTGTPLPAELGTLVRRLSRFSQASSTSFVWETTDPADPAAVCAAGLANYLREIGEGIDQLIQEFGNVATRKSALEGELKTLQERRSNVLAEMSEGAAAARVAKNIPVLMLIIFGVGAIVLAGLRLFSDEIQLELVSSGQIVQFVTILILLGIILALGLADRLKEEALGTLLGGLAGYVLSQGVGRQERSRTLQAVKAVVPGQQIPAA
jgi:hypothetical protein